jgi:ketosteroid isomerase-like protein
VCHVWKLSDGKATNFQQYADTGQLQEAMGTRQAEDMAAASVA